MGLRSAFKRKSSRILTGALAIAGAVIGAAVAFAGDPGVTSRIDYAMTFNGTDTYLRTESQVLPASGSFTVESFIKVDPGQSNFGWVWSTGKPTDAAKNWGVVVGDGDASAGMVLQPVIPDGYRNGSYFRVPVNEWLHITLTYDSTNTTYYFYINGTQVDTGYVSTPTPAAGLSIGRGRTATEVQYGAANSYFKGQIDEVKVFNTVRTPAQMLTDTRTYLATNTAGLVAAYDFNEGGTGLGTIYDRTANNYDLTVNGTAAFSDIAQYTNTSRTTNVVRFNRSYLTQAGGWYSPGGVSNIQGYVYGGGGGGGGGAWETVGAAGGGGGAGQRISTNNSTASNSLITVQVGVGGIGGGPSWNQNVAGLNGNAGQASRFNATTAAGGSGGYGGGLAAGTATYSAGVGGKGAASGNGYSGSTMTGADGGAGAGYAANVSANTRVAVAGVSDTYAVGETFVKGGDGGVAYASQNNYTSYDGANGAPASGSGGGGGGGGSTSSVPSAPGGAGASGTIIVYYSINTTTQDYDYLYTFSGSGQWAESAPNATALNVSGDFTLEAWVNPTNTCASAYCTIAGRDNNYILATSNGTYWWRIANSNSGSAWFNTGVPLLVGQWQHVALVRSGTSVLLYVNGQLMATQADGDTDASGTTISLTATSTPGTGMFAIATRGIDHVDLFAGGIDEVRLWSVVRTATEIGDPSTGDFNRPLNTTELASANLLGYWDMNDTSSQKIFVNRKTGASPTTDLGVFGTPFSTANGLSASVNTRYLTLNSTYNTVAYTPDSPSYELTGSTFTISGWWYVTACSNNYLVSKANTYSVALDSACKINVQLDPGNEGAAQTWQWMNTGYAVTKSVWHYVSAIKNGTTLFVYVDGNLVSTINDGDSVQTFNSTGNVTAVVPANLGDRNTYFGIGSTGTGASRSSITTENIDDIRLWNTDRSTKQALDMAGFVPHTQAGLQALFDFNALLTTTLPVPNLASAGASDPLLTVTSTLISTVGGAATPVPGQPSRQQTYLNRSLIKSSTQLGNIPSNYTSAEYWLMGGGGGGGTGGNSGYTGAGGGSGGLVEGTVTGLTTGVSSETVTTMKVGVGGRYAINNGDSVQSGASSGTSTIFAATGFTQTAAGGGAGGSGTTNPANAPQGLAGGSGGGSAQTGGAGGAATQGFAGGAGSASASGGGGGSKSAGLDANSGAGGSGGKGFVLPYYGFGANPPYVGAGGSGNGTSSAGNANSAFGATAAAADATAASGSGGGGAGFTSASTGTSRGGYGGGGFIFVNSFAGHPFAESAPTTMWSGKPSSTPLVVSIRDINGDLIPTATGTVSVTVITSGCNAQGTYSGTVSGGRATIPNLTIYSNAVQVCQINLTYNLGGTGSFYVQAQTAPASIVVNTSATTGTCSFVQGAFVCPYSTAANLNVNDLIAQLNTNDVLLSTTGGDITINSPIAGTTGALSMAAYGTVRLNAGIALSGANKVLTIQALNHIIGNDSATSGSPTAFSTNGGAMYLYTMMTSNSSAGYVKLSNYNTFTTNGGAFIVSGGPDPTTGYASGSTAAQTTDITANGIYIATGASVNTGAGNVSLRGKLQGSNTSLYTPGTGGTTTWPAGVSMQPNSGITTTSGAITILGSNPGFTFDNAYRTGVKLDTATISSGSGAINITGTSVDAASNLTAGIYVAGTSVTSSSGNIAVSGTAPTNATAPISFASAESTIGSTTGDVALSSGNTYLNTERLEFLRLTGGGNHTLSFPYVTFNTVTNGFNAVGSGNLTITTPTGMAFTSTVTVPAIANFGTSYQNITISDNTSSSSTSGLSMNANLTASNSVLLRAASISGSGSVTAPGLAMVARNTTAAYSNQLTGASDVDTLALTHGSSLPTGGMGITDADGWTPGTVAGVVGVYGVAKNISTVSAPSSSVTKGQVLPQQPVVKIVDAYGKSLTSSNLSLSNYTLTPSITSGTPTTAITPTTPVTFDSSGQSTFSGLKFTSSGSFTLAYTVSPALTGTSTLSGGVTVAASTGPTSIVASPSTINATSNTNFTVTATYLDPYGNQSGTVTGGYMPTVALTSMPAGVQASALSGNFGAASNGVSSATNLKINGPTGTYVITVTSGYGTLSTANTSTVTINLTGWSLSYGAASLPYQLTTYAPTFSGNGTGAVTYASSTTAVCTVNSSTGAVQPVQPGTCTINATQAADANYGTGTATATFTITKGTQATVTLAPSPPTLVYGSSVLLVGAGGNGGSFTYTKVSGNCTLTTATLASGTANAGDVCVVNATRAGDIYWNAATSADYSITVAGMAQAAVTVPTGKTVPYNTATDLTLSPYTPTGGSGTGAWQFSTVTPNCSISGNLLTSTVAVGGTCVISVVKAASGNYAASTAVNMTVSMAKGNQSVSYVTVASSVRVGDSVTVNATSTSGLTVSYAIASGSNAYCSLSNGSTVTFTSPGTCVINATQSGDSNYNAASTQTLTYTVAKGIQTITFNPMTDDVVRTTTRAAVATASSGLTVTFSVGGATTNSACTVTSVGAISLNAVGLCQITASQTGDTNYDAATDVSVSFLVAQGTQSALVITSATSVAYGNTLALTATGGNGSSSYSWTATGDCTVNGSTLSVGSVGGNCVVSVDRAGDANWYAATTASQTITITKASQATLTVSASNSVVYGNTLLLNYSGGSGTGAVSYATTGTCTESNGVLTVGDAGSSCAVTVTKDADSNYNAATSASFTVTITRAQQAAVTITSNSTVVYGNTLTLAASGGTGGGSISYSTTGTCSVSNGVLTVGNVGSTCTVTATSAQSTNYSAESSAPMTITIVKANQTITITSTASSPTALGSYVVAATADSGLAVDFSIDPSTSSACFVSGSAVTFVTSGDCLILADQAGNNNFNAAPQQSQLVTAGLASQSIIFNSPGAKHYGDSPFAAGATIGSGLTISYSLGGATTNNSCSVTSQGTITIQDVGTCEILADQAGDNVFDAAPQASVTFTIARGNQAALSISSASTVAYGNTISLTTSGGSGTGAVTYATTGTCTESNGVLTVGNAGSTCTVTATKAGDSQYVAVSSSAQTITITKANQSISFVSLPSSPTALGNYSVIATSSSGVTVTFTIAANSASVCSVSGNTVSFLTSGSCEILADQAGNTNFDAAPQATQIVTVGKATQTITIPDPGTMHVGDAAFNAGATSDSSLQIAYSLGSATTNNSCSITSSGVITIAYAGACEIVADQAGDVTYNPAITARRTFAIAAGPQVTLTISSASTVTYGNTISLTTSGGSGTGAVTYATAGTCSVSGSTLTVGDAGSSCSVTATKAADANYTAASSSAQTVIITKANQSITISATGSTPTALGSNTLTGTATSGLTVDLTVDASTSANCSLSGNTLNFLRSGSCLVNADQAGNTNYNAAPQAQRTFTIAKAAQTISITNPGSVRYGDATFQIAASATSGLSITYSTGTNTTNSACSIDSGGNVTINDIGDCEVTANQAGDSVYAAATATSLTFQVAKGAQATLAISSASSVAYGNTIALTTTGGSGQGSVSYTATGTCSVSGSTLTVGVVGSACTVTATKAADTQYEAINSAAQTVTIVRASQPTLTMSSASNVAYGNTITLAVSGGAGDGAVTYVTTGTCSEANGILTVGDAGSACTVTATKAQSANFNSTTSATQTITIDKANQQPLVITSATSGTYGDLILPTVSGGSGSGAVSYIVGGQGCSPSQGQLALVAAGRPCSLTAVKAASTNYNSETSSTISITVNKANQVITVTSTPTNPQALGYYNPSFSADSGLNVSFSIDASSSSVCQVRLTSVEFLTSGTCLVNFDQAGDSNRNPAPQVQQSINVATTAQTITFPVITTKNYLDAAFQAQASSDSGLAISYSLGVHTTNNSCSVTSGGLISILDTGFCEIYANQAGNNVYSAASMVSQNFSIDRAAQAAVTLTNASTVTYGNTLTLTAAGGSGTGAFSYTVDSGTCSLSGAVLTVGNAGSLCTVYATRARDSQFADEASAIMTITVTRATQAAFSISSASSVAFGGTINLATSGGSGSGAVTYATTGTCSESNGVLTVGHAGSSCTVTATKGQSTNYSAATSATQTVTVTKANQTVSITSTPSAPTALGSYSVTGSATSGLTVAFTIDASATAVCSVTGTTVSFIKSGSCVINADQAGDNDFNAATQTQQIFTVAKKSQLTQMTSITDKAFGDAAFYAAGSADSTLAVVWSTGPGTTNSSCSVDPNTGLVTILANGACNIIVDQPGNDVWAPATSSGVMFNIGQGNQATLTMSSASTVVFGGSINLATSGGSGTGTVTYAVTGTCTLQGGTLIPGDAGSACSVTATKAADARFFAASSAAQTITVTRANQAALTITSASSAYYGNTISLTVSGGSGNGSVSYATTGSCTEAGGVLTLGAAGSNCTVTATKAASTNYNAVSSAAQTVQVLQTAQTINFTSTPSAPTALGSYTVAATATSGLSVSFAIDSASTSVCSISGATVSFLTGGSCVINATQSGDSNFGAAQQVQQTITVAKKAQNIQIASPADRNVGDPAFTLGVSLDSGRTLTYYVDSNSQSVCSVDQNGLVTVLALGVCSVYATNSGDATWASTGTPGVTFQVGKGTQALLTMTSANSVTYGSTISLTASGGSSTGSISYAATGACSVNNYILTVGDVGSSCSVVATKAGDANWYATSSAAQSITVTRAAQATLTVAAASTQAFGTTQLLNYAGGSGDGAVTYAATGACSASGATLTIGAVGTNCSIIATKAQSTNYLAATSAAFAITATQAAQTVSFTTTASSPTALGSYTVAATATSGLSVAITVDSASASVCSISGATVSFLTGGSCVLNANQAGNTNYTAATQVPQTINVALAAQTITFATPAAMTVTDAATQLSASASSSLQIAFAVGSGTTNTACSITGSGVVTPLAVGTCEITADQAGNATYSAAPRVTRSFAITRANQAALSISSASSVAFGSTISLTTTGGSGTGAVTYSTTGTCTVSGSTLTVGNAGSSCAVTATKAQDANYFAATSAAQTITVTRVNQATLQIASASSVTFGQSLSLVFTGGSGSGAETWSVDTSVNQNTAGCAVNNQLTIMSATSTGSCDLVVAKAASTNYNAATSARFSVSVTRASQTVNFTSTIPSSPVSGGTYTLAATATSGLSVSFSLAGGSSSYCSLSGNVVTFNATGNCVVNADQAGNSNYTAASTQSQTIAIGSRNQTITFAAIANRTYGDASFTLGASVPSTASVTYALGGGTTNSACSVTSSGIVSVLAVGRCEIVASALGDSQYAPASSVSRAFDVVADRASAPFITSVSAGNGSATVSFTAPTYTGGVAISGYEINAYRNGILVASSNACAANATSCTITGLTNGYSYTFKMDALNAAGSGIESAASAAVVPYTRPEAVGALAAVAANTAVNLTWQQPGSLGGGTFVSYQIFVRTHGGSYPVNPTATVNSASTTSYALTGLINGQAYDIKVVTITTAANTQQVSNTAEVQQTPMTVPDAPQQLTIIETLTDGVVDVSWAAPNSDGGSPITGYTVDLGNGHTCSVAGNATTCQISNLTSATTYNVSAIATNAAGNSLSAGTMITLRVGSAVSQTGPPIFTAAFGITVETVSSFASIDTTDRKRVSTAGGSRIVIAGFNLDKVTRVTVDGRPTIIIKKTSAAMLIQLPGSAEEGWADLWFYAPNASLRYVDGIYYATATIHPVLKPVTKIVYGFASVQKSLASWQKALAKSAVLKAGKIKTITCTGVAANAKLTCAYVKTLRPGVPVIVKAVKPVKNSVVATVVKLTFTR
mgnify:CR=1 FL=1